MKANNPSFLFVIPDTHAFQSGGNVYNRQLIDALRQRGITIAEVTADRWNSAMVRQPWTAIFWDSLYLQHPKLEEAASNTPLYIIVHHLESLYPPEGIVGESLFQKVEYPNLALGQGFLVTSRFTRDYLIRHFPKARYLRVEPALVQLPNRVIKKADTLRILVAGNLIARKGVLSLLQCLRDKSLLSMELRIVGSATHESAYAEACLHVIEALPNVYYLGEVPHSAMSQQYHWCNLLVSASKMETFGMTMQEATAFGVPILALNHGNARAHIVNGKNGRTVDTIEELYQQLKALTEHPQLLQRWLEGAQTINIWDQYTWNVAAEILLEKLHLAQ